MIGRTNAGGGENLDTVLATQTTDLNNLETEINSLDDDKSYEMVKLLLTGKPTSGTNVDFVVPDEITDLRGYIFAGWSYPNSSIYELRSVVLPKKLKYIRGSCFAFSHGLNTVDYSKVEETLISVDSNAFENCSDLNFDKLIPVKQYNYSTFKGCRSLSVKTLPAPSPTDTIGIGWHCFQDCTSLTEISFEWNVPNLGIRCFDGCTNLTKFSFPNNTAVPTLSNVNAIPNGANFTGTIEVPASLLDEWKSATNWSSLTNVTWVALEGK